MNVSVARRCGQVALLAMAVLILEVALTRDFAFMMFCHFTYLVISVALLGFGAAGTYLTAWRPESRHASGDEFIARHAWYFGVASIGAVVLISRIRFYPVDVFSYGDYSQLLSLLIIVVAAGIPFFFAGSCIGFIVSRSGEGVTSVYFADLAGAAVGCLMAIVVLVWLGAVAACFVVGAAAMVVAVMSGTVRRTRYLRGSGVAAVLALVVANTNALPLDAPPDKVLFRQQHLIELTKWHPITRLDVTRPLHENRSFGGALSERYSGPPPEVRFIYQDGDAITGIIRPENSPETTEVLGYYLQGAPYSIRKAADVLTIGCGGGVDVMIALHGGAKHVVGVDVNPQTVALLEGRYANFARGVFQRDDVELVAAEGRHFLTRDDRRFDVIQLRAYPDNPMKLPMMMAEARCNWAV